MLKQIISSGLLLLVLAGGSPILADNTKKGAPSKPVQQDNAQQRKLTLHSICFRTVWRLILPLRLFFMNFLLFTLK